MDKARAEKLREIRKLAAGHILDCTFISEDQDAVKAVIQHPGMVSGDYDVNGQPKLWQMMRLMGAARFFAHSHPLDQSGRTFRDFSKMSSDRMTFMISSEIIFYKELYDFSIKKTPLRMHVLGGYIGSSSLNTITKMFDSTEKVLLSSSVTQVVSIDRETRRPKPLPDWWREKYAASAKEHVSLKFDKMARPDNASSYECHVSWSDTDAYCHTNWASYARYVVDAAHHSSRKGDLPPFEENLTKGLHRIELHYCGESFMGDTLTVYSWEDQNNLNSLYFDLCKADKSIFQCKFHFFDS
ncbi:uncharacterized protein LOC110462886 [Mizuhopecten yessoensis]|uniref:Uncharacterized protein n=1 Tax=Mizuhopecten yessoensis TaxID=6573 RepID=A0A210PXA6_MIZYE|nr:uncharacterized protein LOC110462886 [Mizuhopecten yessoensis]OWF41120.1 hypothetical protein KP79_PYT04783 [Mizuhopecten yessoensis]